MISRTNTYTPLSVTAVRRHVSRKISSAEVCKGGVTFAAHDSNAEE